MEQQHYRVVDDRLNQTVMIGSFLECASYMQRFREDGEDFKHVWLEECEEDYIENQIMSHWEKVTGDE